jgi:bla regulator protein BlaR1
MIKELTNHLWQSTLFAIAAGLMTLAFRQNHAKVRYWLWLSASLKFLIPFLLLIDVGSHFGWAPAAQKLATQVAGPAIQFTVGQISEPFAQAITPTLSMTGQIDWFPVILAMWVCGLLAIVSIRLRAWLRIRSALQASTPAVIQAAVEVRLSQGLVEPGVVGLFYPILLLPEGIVERLTPAQLEAVLAHELCHIRRRDNLCASLHMIVEALFWFHPLVWWIGARLVEERERACDEEVLSLGNQASVYADAILQVCKLYLESPLACVSGVAGSDIRRRIEAIMSNRGVEGLNRAKKFLLAGAGSAALVAPVAIGIIAGLGHVPSVRAQAPSSAPAATGKSKFDVASVKPCATGDITAKAGGRGGAGRINWSPGRLRAECQTVEQLIREAYLRYPDGKPWPTPMDPRISDRTLTAPIKGSPAWAASDRYTIEAEADGTPDEAITRGPMLQALLEDRFQLRMHSESREMPVYELTVASGGPKLKRAQEGSCIPWGERLTATPRPAPDQRTASNMPCGLFIRSRNQEGLDVNGTTIEHLCRNFSAVLDRDVIDKTGIEGLFDIYLDIPPEPRPADDAAGAGPSTPPGRPDPERTLAAIKAAVQKLGLRLEAAKADGKFLVIDHAERPSEN